MIRAFLSAAARRAVIRAHKKKADRVFIHSIVAVHSP